MTGSSSGIGEATAHAALRPRRPRRRELGVVGRRPGRRSPTRCPPSPSTCRPTSATRHRARRLIDRTIEHFGRLDILVNNAGWTTVVPHDDLDALTDEILRRTFEVNVFGTWWLTKAAMPHLRASRGPVRGDGHLARRRPADGVVDRLRDDEGGPQPPHAAARQVVRTGAGERGRARPGGDAVDGRLARRPRARRQGDAAAPRRPRRRTAPRRCSASSATATSPGRSWSSTAAARWWSDVLLSETRFLTTHAGSLPRPDRPGRAARPAQQGRGGRPGGAAAGGRAGQRRGGRGPGRGGHRRRQRRRAGPRELLHLRAAPDDRVRRHEPPADHARPHRAPRPARAHPGPAGADEGEPDGGAGRHRRGDLPRHRRARGRARAGGRRARSPRRS